MAPARDRVETSHFDDVGMEAFEQTLIDLGDALDKHDRRPVSETRGTQRTSGGDSARTI